MATRGRDYARGHVPRGWPRGARKQMAKELDAEGRDEDVGGDARRRRYARRTVSNWRLRRRRWRLDDERQHRQQHRRVCQRRHCRRRRIDGQAVRRITRAAVPIERTSTRGMLLRIVTGHLRRGRRNGGQAGRSGRERNRERNDGDDLPRGPTLREHRNHLHPERGCCQTAVTTAVVRWTSVSGAPPGRRARTTATMDWHSSNSGPSR